MPAAPPGSVGQKCVFLCIEYSGGLW